MFTGSFVALITPFSNGTLDESALRRLIKFHLDNGTNGIVPVGTTGEAPTLTRTEHRRVVEIVANEVGGEIPVIAGAGSYNTVDAIDLTNAVADAGADAALHVTGYYNRPNQEGIFQHFKALEEATDLPILVYNVPHRAVVDIQPNTMGRLSQLRKIIGVKDSTGDLARPLIEQMMIKNDFCFLTGEDPTAVSYRAQGGNGCISVTANIAPALCAEMHNACSRFDFKKALEIQRKLMPLHQALFAEPSPSGAKYASMLLDLCAPNCRLPIFDISEQTKVTIKSAMRELDLI